MAGRPSERITRWRQLAEHWGRQTGCPPGLILATIQQESGGNPAAVRYEPEYEKRYGARCAEIARACRLPTKDVATSYGLMQLMLPLAWGYLSAADKADPTATLCDPGKNIRYGAAHLGALLKKELARHNDAVRLSLGLRKEIDAAVVRAVAGAYNGGGSDSAHARNVCALWQRYEMYLKEALFREV